MSAVYLCDETHFQWAGIFGISCVERRRTKSALYGYGYFYRFQGLPSAINAAFLSLAADQDGEIIERGPIHELTVRTADDPSQSSSTVLNNTFELLGNSIQKDIREHPLALGLGPEILAKIDRILNNIQLRNASGVLQPLEEIDENNADEVTLYDALRQRRGNMAFNVSQFVFRVTTILSQRATGALTIAYAGMNTVYTTANLISETNPPSGYVFSVQEAAEQTAPTPTAGFTYGWLKQSPTVTAAPGNRIAVQVEYWLGEWEDWVYA